MSDDCRSPDRVFTNDRQSGGPPPDPDRAAALRSDALDQHEAAARRGPVPHDLAEALVESGEPEVVAALLGNRSAELSERLLLACLDRLADDEAVQKAMIGRERLPPAVRQRLGILASGRIRTELLARHALPTLPEGEPDELGPDRPRWWSQHIEGLFR